MCRKKIQSLTIPILANSPCRSYLLRWKSLTKSRVHRQSESRTWRFPVRSWRRILRKLPRWPNRSKISKRSPVWLESRIWKHRSFSKSLCLNSKMRVNRTRIRQSTCLRTLPWHRLLCQEAFRTTTRTKAKFQALNPVSWLRVNINNSKNSNPDRTSLHTWIRRRARSSKIDQQKIWWLNQKEKLDGLEERHSDLEHRDERRSN